MKIGRAAAAPGFDSIGNQLDDLVEGFARQTFEGRGVTHESIEIVFLPGLGRAGGHDLLCQDVERCPGWVKPIEAPLTDSAKQARAFDQLVASQRVEPALRRSSAKMTRSPHALKEGRDASGRTDLTDEFDRPDIDSQFERCRGDERAKPTLTQSRLDTCATILRQAPVMSRDLLLTQPLGELVGQTLGHAPRIHEDEGRLMKLHLLRDPIEDLRHLFGGRNRFEITAGQHRFEIERSLMTFVDDRTARLSRGILTLRSDSDEQLRNELDRPLRRREANACGPVITQCVESFEAQREMRSPFVSGHCVDLVDDHRSHRPQNLATTRGRQQ